MAHNVNDFYWLYKNNIVLLYCREYCNQVKSTYLQFYRCESPILIYTLGKVGSQTIKYSLKAIEKDPVFHIHHLSEDFVVERKEIFEKGYMESILDMKVSMDPQLLRSKLVRKVAKTRYLQNILTRVDKRWKIITLIREPMSRMISSLFYSVPKKHAQLLNLDDCDFNLDENIKLMNDLLEKSHDSYAVSSLNWFDNELNKVFGINVFLEDFPKTKGYKIYDSKNFDLLLIRLEDLNHCHRQAFKDFLNIDDFKLVKSNTNQGRGYDELYKKFKGRKFSKNIIDKMYSVKDVCHFYTQEEIDGFKAKWTA